MGNRRQAREMALQALYLNDTCGFSSKMALETISSELASNQEIGSQENERTGKSLITEFCEHLVNGVFSKKDEIDAILARYTENWDIKRMATVDRNILRLSTFEIITDLGTPISVIIDEAIEIAKNFSTEDSGKFVNGILDKVKQERK